MPNKIIKLEPRKLPKDDLVFMTSLVSILGDIDDQINQHYAESSMEKDDRQSS